MITQHDIDLLYEVAGALEDNGLCDERAKLEELAARIDATRLRPVQAQIIEVAAQGLRGARHPLSAGRLEWVLNCLKGTP